MPNRLKNKPNSSTNGIRDRIKRLDRVPAGSLVANPRNWRTHPERQRAAVQGILSEIGYADALIAREDDKGRLHLIDGHLRADLDPMQVVPVLVLDVTEAEGNKLLLTLDPLVGLAETNTDHLQALLNEVETDDANLAGLLAEMAASNELEFEHDLVADTEQAPVVEDEVPPEPHVAITKPGDLWLLGEHRLLCGDSRKAADVARLLAGEKATAIITDPPYGVSYVGKTSEALPVHNDGKEDLLPLLRVSLGHACKNSIPGAVWYVAAPAGPQFYDFATVLREHEIWRQTLVWAKQSLVMGHSDYHYQHEAIFYGWTPGAAHQAPPDRKQTTLWFYDRPTASLDHPTMKPVALYAKMVENSTLPGALVYEPFGGSGTTLVACEQLGRRCYAIELGDRYCDVIVKRWENLTGKKAVLAKK